MDVWTYPDPELLGANIRDTDVTGYGVEALDGSIGKIDEAGRHPILKGSTP